MLRSLQRVPFERVLSLPLWVSLSKVRANPGVSVDRLVVLVRLRVLFCEPGHLHPRGNILPERRLVSIHHIVDESPKSYVCNCEAIPHKKPRAVLAQSLLEIPEPF